LDHGVGSHSKSPGTVPGVTPKCSDPLSLEPEDDVNLSHVRKNPFNMRHKSQGADHVSAFDGWRGLSHCKDELKLWKEFGKSVGFGGLGA